jgi:hypothetical protein
MSAIERHHKICTRQRLPVVGPVYKPFKRLRQERQLPFYHELVHFVDEHEYITDRQFYYHLVEQPEGSPIRLDVSTRRKSDNAYDKVINLTVTCRLGGIIPLDSILDDTDLLGTQQFDEPIESYLIGETYGYRSNWFEYQPYYIECWLEKRAMSRIFSPITDNYGVYLSVSGRYPSLAQVKSAIDRFESYDQPKVILYFGDLDPTGKDMPRYLNDTFPELDCADVAIEEITVNVPDVEELDLPTIPLKTGDTRLEWYTDTFRVDYGVEIDALPPTILRQKIQDAIAEYLDLNELEQKKAEDREEINDVIRRLREQMQND